MGHIISRLEDIASVSFTNIPKGRVVKASRVVKLTDAGYLIELANGKHIAVGQYHVANGKWAVANYGLDHFSRTVLNALVKMDVIKKEHVTEHLKNVEKKQDERNRKHAIKQLKDVCETLNIPMPEIKE